MSYPFVISNESVAVIMDGTPFTVKKSDPLFNKVLAAVMSQDWEAVEGLVNRGKAVEAWSRGHFEYREGQLWFRGQPVPAGLNNRIVAAMQKGSNYLHYLRFYQRLQFNPSEGSVEQLFRFMDQNGLAIGKDGCILAYKVVRKDYWDCHTGRTHRYLPGAKVEMDRDKVVEDPTRACASGLHVGALSYFGGGWYGLENTETQGLIVKVDPADVVSVPYDYNSAKVRCCRVYVVGHYGTALPDTLWDDEILPGDTSDEDWKFEALDGTATEEERARLAEELREGGDGESSAPHFRPTSEWPVEYYDDDEEDEDEDWEDQEVEVVRRSLPEDLYRGDPRQFDQDLGGQTVPVRKLAPSFMDLDMMEEDELEDVELEVLQGYATRHLFIVGARHIPDGKTGLLRRIMHVRAGRQN